MIATASTNAAIIIVIIVYLGSCCDNVACSSFGTCYLSMGHSYIMSALRGKVLDLRDFMCGCMWGRGLN